MYTVTLEHLLARGVCLEPHEAVAIAQALIESPAGLPAPDNIEVRSDGSVGTINGRGAPSVEAVASFLDELLPRDKRVPAALRYAVARGTGAVEAAPFASLSEFSAVLRRFEAGDRGDVIRSLLGRIAAARRRPAAVAVATAGRPARAVDALALSPPAAVEPVVAAPPRATRRFARRVVAVFALLICCAAAGFTSTSLWTRRHASVSKPVQPPPPQVVARAVVNESPAVERVAERQPAAVPLAPVRPLRPQAHAVRAVRALPPEQGRAFSPAFSSNGTALFYQTGATRDASSAIAMATLPPLGGDLRIMKVVDDGSRNYHAQPSPDGRLVAFDSDRDGERGVYVSNADGSDVRKISGPGYAAIPTWSPDGSQIAYIRAEAARPAVWNLWVQPADGGTPRRLTNHRSGQTWGASWFPDGRQVAYTREQTLTVLDLETGKSRHFASPIKGALVRTPAVSPDGSKVVFQVFRHGAWLLDLTDRSMVCVLADPTAEEFAWAPDGRRIAFHSRRDGSWGIYLLHRG